LDACFSKPTLPAASAGAANRTTCQNGKFHGITASTAPRGWNWTSSWPSGAWAIVCARMNDSACAA
jgi:hypothetical protein